MCGALRQLKQSFLVFRNSRRAAMSNVRNWSHLYSWWVCWQYKHLISSRLWWASAWWVAADRQSKVSQWDVRKVRNWSMVTLEFSDSGRWAHDCRVSGFNFDNNIKINQGSRSSHWSALNPRITSSSPSTNLRTVLMLLVVALGSVKKLFRNDRIISGFLFYRFPNLSQASL